MPICSNWAYFDHAAVAPLPLPTVEAIRSWCDQASQNGATGWPSWYRRAEQVRTLASQIINASPKEISLVPSTTAGINLVAEGFPWQEGDNVVTLDTEFPSNLYPWLNLAHRGVETRVVPTERGKVDLNRIAEHCDQRTRIISLSWIGYASGWRLDLAAAAKMAHDQNSLLFVDAIQGLGVFPIDVEKSQIDFLAADGHKWMLGPEGAGIFFTRSEHLDLLRPTGVGWHSVKNAFEFSHDQFELRSDAARYEGGSRNMPGFLGLAASLELLREQGLRSDASPLADRILAIAERASDLLAACGADVFPRPPIDHQSGIVIFEVPEVEPMQVRRACLDDKIAVSCRGGGVRISPHAYNSDEEIDQLIATVRKMIIHL
ncbi:MAG: aminotransferase class V-fold PLP-dependent enzyme [Planctomycetaceae bacterium]|nr:aminotransferase class V-fold PLP-dependent enzyme [Planctomycetaceae bacterium]